MCAARSVVVHDGQPGGLDVVGGGGLPLFGIGHLPIRLAANARCLSVRQMRIDWRSMVLFLGLTHGCSLSARRRLDR